MAAAFIILLAAGTPAWSQRLLIGAWQTQLDQSRAMLTIITVDGDGWVHGMLYYDPPRPDGFGGSPFTTHIENGAFSISLVNGTRYADLHWCRDELCGTYYSPDNTATPVDFARPP